MFALFLSVWFIVWGLSALLAVVVFFCLVVLGIILLPFKIGFGILHLALAVITLPFRLFTRRPLV